MKHSEFRQELNAIQKIIPSNGHQWKKDLVNQLTDSLTDTADNEQELEELLQTLFEQRRTISPQHYQKAYEYGDTTIQLNDIAVNLIVEIVKTIKSLNNSEFTDLGEALKETLIKSGLCIEDDSQLTLNNKPPQDTTTNAKSIVSNPLYGTITYEQYYSIHYKLYELNDLLKAKGRLTRKFHDLDQLLLNLIERPEPVISPEIASNAINAIIESYNSQTKNHKSHLLFQLQNHLSEINVESLEEGVKAKNTKVIAEMSKLLSTYTTDHASDDNATDRLFKNNFKELKTQLKQATSDVNRRSYAMINNKIGDMANHTGNKSSFYKKIRGLFNKLVDVKRTATSASQKIGGALSAETSGKPGEYNA